MNCIFFQVKTVRLAAVALIMFLLIARFGQAQTYYVGFTGPITQYGDLGAGYANEVYYPLNALAVGDFNGDGKPDLITGSYESGQLSFLEGNGDGTFGIPVQIDQLVSIVSVAIGDFNNDGNRDVAALWETGAGVGINLYLGNGAGGFELASSMATSSYGSYNGYSLAAADFNHDGKLDLVAVTIYNNAANVLLGNGDGTFQSPVVYSTIDPNNPGQYNPYGVAVADFNGDGIPDMAFSQGAGISVLLNNGNGTFGTAVYYSGNLPFGAGRNQGIAAAPLTNAAHATLAEKRNDIVLATSAGALPFLNDGHGVFTPQALVGEGTSQAMVVAVADVNSDGNNDILFGDISGSVRIFFGEGNGSFSQGPAYPVGVGVSQATYLATADLNGEGFVDWMVENTSGGELTTALGNGDGTYRTNSEYGWNSNAEGRNIVTADFNGDGFPDVAYSYVFGTNGGKFAVMLGSLHGQLSPQAYFAAGSCVYNIVESIAAGDVNGDGKPDIVAAIENSSNSGCENNVVAVVLGSGTGKFANPVYYSTGVTAQAYEIRLADMNNDGKLDIVTSNADGSLSVLLNKGNGKFGPAIVTTSLMSLYSSDGDIAIADFNNDGLPDIALTTWGTQPNFYVLLNTGNGTFGTPEVIPTGYYPMTLVTGDFNNDGNKDLIVTADQDNPCGAPLDGDAAFAVFLGNGSGGFTGGPLNCTQAEYPSRPVVADFNADGILDLFIPMEENAYGNNMIGPALYQGNGDGTFTRAGDYDGQPRQLYYTGAVDVDAVVADFNNDGQPDIAVLDNDNINAGNDSYSSFVVEMINLAIPVSLSPVNLQFGTVAEGSSKVETVILTNDQLANLLDITSITVGGADPGDFSQTSNCQSSEPAGADCTIKVTFKPTQSGARTATLYVKDNIGTQTVQLSGTGK